MMRLNPLRFGIAALAPGKALCKMQRVFALAASACFILFPSCGEAKERAHFAGAVTAYIADLKPSFPEHEMYSPATALTTENYRAVLDGLKSKAGVNGVRLPIIPEAVRAADASSLYRRIHAYARQLGLLIYASPMSVGFSKYAGWSNDQYAEWLADYANVFQPDVLSPFNESGIDDSRMTKIISALRAKLKISVKLAGPDRQHVQRTVESLIQHYQIGSLFDIVDSHNANLDFSANRATWALLVRVAKGKPVWSSENPAAWGHGARPGLPGLDQAVRGGVNGIVIWLAKPTLVDDNGRRTAKADEIATHLLQRDPSR